MYKFKLVIFLCFPLVFLFVVGSFPIEKEITGNCSKVLDGDTIIVNNHKIRLKGIDAPELKQLSSDGKPIGQWSKKYLENLILNQVVSVKYYEKGFYGRIIGTIYFQNKNINKYLIKNGLAISTPYSKQLFKNLELEARLKRKGIFSTYSFVRPYFYRKGFKNVSK